jgi:hypothetical protein
MLVGAAVVGFLLWFATQVEGTTAAGYWAFIGLIAAAGLVLALSQVAGGWTKWGRPRWSGGAFLLGFLPALVIGGWVLLAAQPEGAWMQATAESWANQLALGGLFETLTAVLPAVAFVIGLLFGFTLDTTGGRVVGQAPVATGHDVREEPVAGERRAAEEEEYVPADRRHEDEPLHAERTEVGDHEEERIESEYREPDRSFVDAITGRNGEARTREPGGEPSRGDEPR